MKGAFCGAWVLDGRAADFTIAAARRKAMRDACGEAVEEILEGPLWMAMETQALFRRGSRRTIVSGFILDGGVPDSAAEAPPAGHYALVEADIARRSLTLCRDPFGSVPLYFSETSGLLLFSTCARSLLASGLVAGRLDREAGLEAVLSADLAVLFGESTLFAGIGELAPGRVAVWLDGKRTSRDLGNAFVDNPGARESVTPADVRDRLLAATRRSIGSSSRVAVALSGGVDSSAVAALAVEIMGANAVEAFTYEFADSSRPPEAPWAARVCRRLGIRHHVVPIEYAEFVRELPALFWRLEAPRLAPGAWTFFSRALGRAGFDRVLTGDGLELALGLPGHLDLSEAIGGALAWLPHPDLSLRYWKGRRFGGWPVRRLARALHPGLEPPHDHSYHMTLCVLRHNAFIKNVAAFYPAELGPLVRENTESARVAGAVGDLRHLTPSDQLRRHRMNAFMLHRLFRGKHGAYRDLGAVPVCPAYFMERPPARPRAGASAGAELRRLAFERDVPAEVFLRPKLRNHSILSDVWADRIHEALAPLALEAAKRFAPADSSRIELRRHFGRELGLLGLWLRIFDAGPVPHEPPTLASLGLNTLFPEAEC